MKDYKVITTKQEDGTITIKLQNLSDGLIQTLDDGTLFYDFRKDRFKS